MSNNAIIREMRGGKFRTALRFSDIAVTGCDPEHELCHALTQAGLPDGPIQFWRDGIRTLSHPSVHRMGRMRITQGDEFPRRIKRGEPMPETFKHRRSGNAQTGQTEAAGMVVANAPQSRPSEGVSTK